jgi:uncharacterized membrane protein YfcA
MTSLTFISVALLGLAIGVLSGMFGIGGGAITIPVLNLIFRLPLLGATSTSLFVIAPTALSGAFRHFRQGTAVVKTAVQIGCAGAITSILSSYISGDLPSVVILVATVAVILYSAVSMFREAVKKPLDDEGHTSVNRFTTPRSAFIAHILIGLFAGSIAGFVGVGGGFIIIPFAVSYFGFSFKQASGTSLLAIALIAIPGIITHALLGHIWYLYGIAIMIGSIPGANLGARIITKLPEKAARLTFGCFLVVSGVMLTTNQIMFGA